MAVDSSVLLAIFKGEPAGEQWLDTLHSAAESASLVASSIVLAEVRSFFSTDSTFREALRDLHIRHSPLEESAAILAGRIFWEYRKQGGPRSTILPDFLVAAHAAMQADTLATDDRGYLRRYFPRIRILSQRGAK